MLTCPKCGVNIEQCAALDQPPDLKQLQELLAKASKPCDIPHCNCQFEYLERLEQAAVAALPALLASHEALSAEVAGLRKDAERLTWLEEEFVMDYHLKGKVTQILNGALKGDTLRAAIDAAREGK